MQGPINHPKISEEVRQGNPVFLILHTVLIQIHCAGSSLGLSTTQVNERHGCPANRGLLRHVGEVLKRDRPLLNMGTLPRLIGDSEECDGELSSWGSTPCGGRALVSSPFSSNISSFAGRVLEEAGRLLRQSPASSDKVASPSLSSIGESASS